MMKCLSVCNKKSSLPPVTTITTRNHPVPYNSRLSFMGFHSCRLVFHGSMSVYMGLHGSMLVFHGSRSVLCYFSRFQVGFSWTRWVFIVIHGSKSFLLIPGRFFKVPG